MNEDHSRDPADGRAAGQQRSAGLALKRAELSLEELWLRYFGMGGDAGFLDIDAYVRGLAQLPPMERDMLAQAVNERLDELTWAHRAGYSRPFRDSQPRSAPFAALVRLLEDSELAPPERLPTIAKTAGEALGVAITIYPGRLRPTSPSLPQRPASNWRQRP